MYQLDVRGSWDGRTVVMCDEAMMAELWEGVDEAVMSEPHKA
jgi:hypothetical protein